MNTLDLIVALTVACGTVMSIVLLFALVALALTAKFPEKETD